MRSALHGHARKHELAVHNHQYPLHCPHCSKGCPSMNVLRNHVRARHRDEDDGEENGVSSEGKITPGRKGWTRNFVQGARSDKESYNKTWSMFCGCFTQISIVEFCRGDELFYKWYITLSTPRPFGKSAKLICKSP